MFETLPLYQSFKALFVNAVGVTADGVHIYAGLCLFLVTLTLFRSRTPSWWALLPGFLVSLATEFMDLFYEWRVLGSLDLRASVHDIVHTNLMPFVLFVAIQWWVRNPQRFSVS